jgi:uncharacterized protein YjbJ (UPF0337 family)
MNKETLKANWNQLKERLKEKYPPLTEGDLQYVHGKEEELFGRLQQKLGKTRAEIEREFDHLQIKMKEKIKKVKAG